MELTTRPRLDSDQRCPYCHDLLVEVQEPIRCESCGTEHHAECVRELGRCTTMGCERSLALSAEVPLEPSIRRQLRERIRQRVRRFVSDNVSERPSRDLEALRLEMFLSAQAELEQALAEWSPRLGSTESAQQTEELSLTLQRGQLLFERVEPAEQDARASAFVALVARARRELELAEEARDTYRSTLRASRGLLLLWGCAFAWKCEVRCRLGR